MAVSVLHWLSAGDHRLMRRVNNWKPPGWMRLWMVAATRGGDGWLWYAMGVVIAVAGGRERFRALAAAVVAVSVGIALFLALKRACGRKRLCALAPHCWATLLPPDQCSFPSGHTITAFAVAISLGAFYPGVQLGLLFCAASVALSRILLGMHFLSDVLAGAALGTASGMRSPRRSFSSAHMCHNRASEFKGGRKLARRWCYGRQPCNRDRRRGSRCGMVS